MATHQFLSSFGIKLFTPTLLHDEDDDDVDDGDSDEHDNDPSLMISNHQQLQVCPTTLIFFLIGDNDFDSDHDYIGDDD